MMDLDLLNILWPALIFLGIYHFYFKDSKLRNFTQKHYGPPQLPIIGSMWEVAGSRIDRTKKFFFDWPKNYGPRYSFSLLDYHFFCTSNPDDTEKLLTSQVNINKGRWYLFLGTLVYGLVGLGGAGWNKRRKMVNPSFHMPILKGFQKTFDEQSKILVELWKKEHSDGVEFNLCPYVARCTLDVICETAMGVKIGAQHDPEHHFIKLIDLGMKLVHYRILKPWFHPEWIWQLSLPGRKFNAAQNELTIFRNNIINEKRAELEAERKKEKLVQNNNSVQGKIERKSDEGEDSEIYMNKKKSVAFLDLMLAVRDDEGNELSDHDLGCEVDTFITAGQDTTAHASSWCLFLLAENPHEQEKVIEELDEIYGDDTTREVTSDDLLRMKHLEYCVKEAQRMRPSVHFIIRQLSEDQKLSDGLVVPKGANFIIHILSLHNDPKVYPEPDKFIPERFTPENCKSRSAYSYVPFSQGPRNCIGQRYAILEEKTLLANIFRNFRVETKYKLKDIALTMDITMRATDGLHVTLKPRHSN